MDGATEIVKQASRSGWEAMMVAAVLIACIGFLVSIIRAWMAQSNERERRMSERIDKLEDFQTNELKLLTVQCKEALDRNSHAVDGFTEALHKNPCLWSADRQAKLLEQFVERVRNE